MHPKPRLLPYRCWLALLATCGLLALRPLQAQPVVGEGGARIVSVENQVKTQRQGAGSFANAVTNEVLGLGDSLSTGPDSSATLGLGEKALYRVDELTDLVLSPAGASAGNRFQVELREGGFYLLNREKAGELKFKTPTASGAILGTEVAVRVAKDGRTKVALLEGRVDLSNEFGSVSLAPGEQGDVQPGQAPTKTALLDAVAPVQWALYYPGILNPADLDLADASRTALADSLAAYRAGDVLGALTAYPVGRTPPDAAEKTYRAALSLSVGQVARAEQFLQGVNSDAAAALRQVIAVARGQLQSPKPKTPSSTASLAESYHAQARNELGTALAAARSAAATAPHFGFARARVAELEFSFGHTAAAKASLARALELSPRNAQAHSLQGFVFAAENHITGALAAFDLALALDSQLAPARLGRGLCQIKLGHLSAGRADLQAAAALEPTRAVFRSYLGKAWNEEHDLARADRELRRARELDPADPTAWLYLALLRQQQNRPNEAVGALEESQTRNENRAVYRSRELLDQDRAVRGANLASVYRDAGLTEPAVREASRAVASDYGNASAHLFLASSYDALRDPRLFNLRYETPWFSELLVANLLAPVGVGTLSQNVSQQEYSRLFERDRFGVSSTTEYYSDGTWTERGSQYGTFGNFGYALDADYRSEPGFARNTDQERTSLYAKAKWQITPADSVFLELLYNDYRNGDTRQLYDPNSASTGFRSTETQEPNVFAGWHHEWAPGQHSLLFINRLDDTVAYADPSSPVPLISSPLEGAPPIRYSTPRFATEYRSALTAYGVEWQQIAELDRHTLVAGVRYQKGDLDTANALTLSGPAPGTGAGAFPPLTNSVSSDLDRFSVYAYDLWQALDTLRFTAGISYERLYFPVNIDLPPVDPGQQTKDKVSPKLGLEWSPLPDTHLRAGWTRSLGGSYYDASVRLEPVQIAGFTQAFRSLLPESVDGLAPGSEFETVSVGLEHRLPTRTYLNLVAERLTSDAGQNVGAFGYPFSVPGPSPGISFQEAQPSTLTRLLSFEERTFTATVNQLLGERWSVGASYRLSEADLREGYPSSIATLPSSPAHDVSATLHQITGFVRFNHESGFFGEFNSVWTQQSNRGYGTGAKDLPGDDFWQFNIFAGYRFLQRRAEVRVGVLNLTRQDYRLNPLNLHDEYPRERTFYTSLRLNF
jgi:Flp pilus assembly protein TadD